MISLFKDKFKLLVIVFKGFFFCNLGKKTTNLSWMKMRNFNDLRHLLMYASREVQYQLKHANKI